jgi:ABC-type sugar transport system permease subunit
MSSSLRDVSGCGDSQRDGLACARRSLKSFDVVYMMTRGGPFHSSDTLAMFMYNESFQKYYMGYGSAISVVLFLIAMVVIAFYFRQVRELEHLYD